MSHHPSPESTNTQARKAENPLGEKPLSLKAMSRKTFKRADRSFYGAPPTAPRVTRSLPNGRGHRGGHHPANKNITAEYLSSKAEQVQNMYMTVTFGNSSETRLSLDPPRRPPSKPKGGSGHRKPQSQRRGRGHEDERRHQSTSHKPIAKPTRRPGPHPPARYKGKQRHTDATSRERERRWS